MCGVSFNFTSSSFFCYCTKCTYSTFPISFHYKIVLKQIIFRYYADKPTTTRVAISLKLKIETMSKNCNFFADLKWKPKRKKQKKSFLPPVLRWNRCNIKNSGINQEFLDKMVNQADTGTRPEKQDCPVKNGAYGNPWNLNHSDYTFRISTTKLKHLLLILIRKSASFKPFLYYCVLSIDEPSIVLSVKIAERDFVTFCRVNSNRFPR